jgi:hypothetical protein
MSTNIYIGHYVCSYTLRQVLDENRVLATQTNCVGEGCTHLPTYAGDPAADMGALARRDRNHASVIWWVCCKCRHCYMSTRSLTCVSIALCTRIPSTIHDISVGSHPPQVLSLQRGRLWQWHPAGGIVYSVSTVLPLLINGTLLEV